MKRKREDVAIDLTLSDEEEPNSSCAPSSSSSKPSALPTLNQQQSVRILTYNIDGLNEVCLEERTLAVLALVLSENPDIIFFQEVVPASFPLLLRVLTPNGYRCSDSSPTVYQHYFTSTFARTVSFSTIHFSREPFATHRSLQGRDLLKCFATTHQGQTILAINLHLESTGRAFQSPESTARQKQLQEALRALAEHSGPGIAGGDLNIRDTEATAVLVSESKKSLSAPVDAAAALGSAPAPTWRMSGRPNVAYRFDRLYCMGGLRPVALHLLGDEEVLDVSFAGGYRTPSDHRAIVLDCVLPAAPISSATPLPLVSPSAAPKHHKERSHKEEEEEEQRQRQVEEEQQKQPPLRTRRELMAAAALRRQQQAKDKV